MMLVNLQERDTAARVEVKVLQGNHRTENERGKLIQTGIEKGTGIGIDLEVKIWRVKRAGIIVKRVEAGREMIMTGTEAERGTGIGGDEQNEAVVLSKLIQGFLQDISK